MAAQFYSSSMATMMAVYMLCGMITLGTAQSDCTNVLISMSPCLNYISGNSSTPSAGCCTQLGTVVRSQPQCLCQVINGGGSNLGLTINQTQALALPSACNVQTPPVSQCNNAAGGPSGSPAGGSSRPNSPNTDNGGGSSKTLPSGNTSASATTGMSRAFPFLLVAIASYLCYLA